MLPEYWIKGFSWKYTRCFFSLKDLRHVLQGVSQLPTQILDVEPLPLLNRLASEVYIVHSKLGLIKQPLDNKDRTWEDKKKKKKKGKDCCRLSAGKTQDPFSLSPPILTSKSGVNLISKETIPFFSLFKLQLTAFRNNTIPIPGRQSNNRMNVIVTF